MAILRAGPWGNLTDSFKDTPVATNVELTYYPVNIAKGNWPNQNWKAWYEVEAGCCAPAQIEATWPVTSDFGSTVTYETQTIDIIEGDCSYFYAQYPDSYYRGYVFQLIWNGTGWYCYFGNEDFAQAANHLLSSTDECDPTGTTTISGTYYYNGYTITVTDPNA